MKPRTLALVLLLLVAPIPVFARHGAMLIDARRATPGVHVELVEMQPQGPRRSPLYHLRASGVPRDVVFSVWTKEFGGAFQEVLRRFRLDETGMLVGFDQSGQSQRLDRVALVPESYPRGAAWEVGLVSDDGTIMAFAKVIPKPITARSGACTLSLELVSRRGDRFLASGSGFAPGEVVAVEWRESERTVKRLERVGGDGQLPPDVLSHRASEVDHQARYSVTGRDCALALDYEWGDAALMRR
jgi:hypothetical protein